MTQKRPLVIHAGFLELSHSVTPELVQPAYTHSPGSAQRCVLKNTLQILVLCFILSLADDLCLPQTHLMYE